MRSWNKPTSDQIEKATAWLAQVELIRYFFDRLENPEWLEPLRQVGYFENPPPAIRDGERARYPIWPQSRYLIRMAGHAPEAVLGILADMPETDNVMVIEDAIDALAEMPADVAVKLVDKAKVWLDIDWMVQLPEKIGRLAVSLAVGGQVDAAFDLAAALLAPVPDNRPVGGMRREARARFSTWDYGEILRLHVSKLADVDGRRTLSLLCNLLNAALDIAYGTDREADLSVVWRPAIEDHEQNLSDSVETRLVTALRDTAEGLVRGDPERAVDVVDALESHSSPIFRRIALHVLRTSGEAVMAFVSQRLTNRKNFDDYNVRHEYALLLAASFSALSEEARREILGWIEAGPDIDEFRHSYKERTGEEPSAELAAGRVGVWQRNRLSPIADSLPEDWHIRYDELVDKFGRPEHPDFVSYSTRSWGGRRSPVSREDLSAKTIPDVIAYLRDWEPSDPGAIDSPSVGGLAGELETAVVSRPAEFAEAASNFRPLRPRYVRALITGLTLAMKDSHCFSWEPVITLAGWVVGRTDDGDKIDSFEDDDADWSATRREIARLLEKGFEPGDCVIPIDQRDGVWVVLEALTNDPDPTAQHEAEYGGTNWDPLTMSINTTRGIAIHALVRHALWIRDSSEAKAESPTFDDMPEVRDTLEHHLDAAADSSLSVRAAYGRWLPWLILLDRQWTIDHLTAIFPDTKDMRQLRDAAWTTYLPSVPPYNNVFEVLRDYYLAAIDWIGSYPKDEQRYSLKDPDEALSEHLMLLYLRGTIGVDDPLLVKYYEAAPPEVRAHALGSVGIWLRGDEQFPEEAKERASTLWEKRVSSAETDIAKAEEGDEADEAVSVKNTYAPEMAEFGWWFASGKLSDNWSIDQLQRALRITTHVEIDHQVVERLAVLADRFPSQAVECMTALVTGDDERWRIFSWRDGLRKIIVAAIDHDESRDEAVELINLLGSLGYHDFADLLP